MMTVSPPRRPCARTLCRGLEDRGYGVTHAATYTEAMRLVEARSFRSAVLDLMIPGGSGFDVLRRLRELQRDTPVLILTARDSVGDRVAGLERGADDYLVKPFAFVELLARLRALWRRPGRYVDPLCVGDLEIDPIHRCARVRDAMLDLTPTELQILVVLVERRGEVLGRAPLLQLVWGYAFDPGTNVVDVHIARLRRKLEAAGVGEVIHTVRGVGYVVPT